MRVATRPTRSRRADRRYVDGRHHGRHHGRYRPGSCRSLSLRVAATGDYDEGISDIDLLAVMSSEIAPELAAHLERMHDELTENNPSWRGRIEVVYVSASGLANLRVVPPRIHVISAGEPFHVINGGSDWTMTLVPSPPVRHRPGRPARN